MPRLRSSSESVLRAIALYFCSRSAKSKRPQLPATMSDNTCFTACKSASESDDCVKDGIRRAIEGTIVLNETGVVNRGSRERIKVKLSKTRDRNGDAGIVAALQHQRQRSISPCKNINNSNGKGKSVAHIR